MDASDRERTDPTGSTDAESVAIDVIGPLVSTPEDFETILRTLVRTADAKGIDVRGGWPVLQDDDESGSWDVEIVEIVR